VYDKFPLLVAGREPRVAKNNSAYLQFWNKNGNLSHTLL